MQISDYSRSAFPGPVDCFTIRTQRTQMGSKPPKLLIPNQRVFPTNICNRLTYEGGIVGSPSDSAIEYLDNVTTHVNGRRAAPYKCKTPFQRLDWIEVRLNTFMGLIGWSLITWAVVSYSAVVFEMEFRHLHRRPNWLLQTWGFCDVSLTFGGRLKVEFAQQLWSVLLHYSERWSLMTVVRRFSVRTPLSWQFWQNILKEFPQ